MSDNHTTAMAMAAPKRLYRMTPFKSRHLGFMTSGCDGHSDSIQSSTIGMTVLENMGVSVGISLLSGLKAEIC